MDDFEVVVFKIGKSVCLHGSSLIHALEEMPRLLPAFDRDSPEYRGVMVFIKGLIHDYALDENGAPINSRITKL